MSAVEKPQCGTVHRTTASSGPGPPCCVTQAGRCATAASCASPPSGQDAANGRRPPTAVGHAVRSMTPDADTEGGKLTEMLRHRGCSNSGKAVVRARSSDHPFICVALLALTPPKARLSLQETEEH